MNVGFNKNQKRQIQEKCHDGEGGIIFREVFSKKNFKSSLQFLHETIILPNSTIGYHLHTGNEEIYYVIEGEGIMTVDGEDKKISSGDAVITHGGSSHGLKNISSKKLKILVFEATY